MAGRPENGDQASYLTSTGHAEPTWDRERRIRMLRRIADALGRPVEDFFKPMPQGHGIATKVDKVKYE